MDSNNIINTAASMFVEKDIEELFGEEDVEDDIMDLDEIDDRLSGVEEEMMLLVSDMSSKRKRESRNEEHNAKRRKKYDMNFFYFTNPFMMERKVFTYYSRINHPKILNGVNFSGGSS